jgi:hypothetical protein
MLAIDLMPEVGLYVISSHGFLMTDVVRRVQRHLSATMKATLEQSNVTARKDIQPSRIHSEFLSEDPNVLQPMAMKPFGVFARHK